MPNVLVLEQTVVLRATKAMWYKTLCACLCAVLPASTECARPPMSALVMMDGTVHDAIYVAHLDSMVLTAQFDIRATSVQFRAIVLELISVAHLQMQPLPQNASPH